MRLHLCSSYSGDGAIREHSLRECNREVDDEFTAIAETWGYWSDGVGEFVPFCPERAKREFAPDAPASEPTKLG